MRAHGPASSGIGAAGRFGGARWCLLLLAVLIAACATVAPPMHPAGWTERLQLLQRIANWDLQGRAAVAIGSRGWQASVDWRQHADQSVVHLAGPLGIGASVLALGPDGLSVNGSPPSPEGVEIMERRLGFALPVANLRYWLLGIPDPASPSSIRFNSQDRVSHLEQAGWTVDFLRYRVHAGDWLPALLVLRSEGVRVRIVVDQWKGAR